MRGRTGEKKGLPFPAVSIVIVMVIVLVAVIAIVIVIVIVIVILVVILIVYRILAVAVYPCQKCRRAVSFIFPQNRPRSPVYLCASAALHTSTRTHITPLVRSFAPHSTLFAYPAMSKGRGGFLPSKNGLNQFLLLDFFFHKKKCN